jgi:hypothetical protein
MLSLASGFANRKIEAKRKSWWLQMVQGPVVEKVPESENSARGLKPMKTPKSIERRDYQKSTLEAS